MVFTETIICSTTGTVNAATATALTNSLTGQNAALPAGGSVTGIAIYRDGNQPVSSGAIMQLGVVGSLSKYITALNSLTTTQLNNNQVISVKPASDVGLASGAELRLTLSAALLVGAITFEITYISYA